MITEHDIARALKEEASQARVPADDLLRKIRAGRPARKRTSWWQGVAAAVVLLGLLGGVAVRELVRQAPVTPASSESAAYENRDLGFRLKSTATLTAPPAWDGQAMIFRFAFGEMTVSRQPRRESSTLESLVAEAIARNEQISSSRIVTVEQGLRELAGQKAGYLFAAYVSATAGRHQESYFLLVDGYEYTVTCGTVSGERTPWEQAKPACEQILSGFELIQKP